MRHPLGHQPSGQDAGARAGRPAVLAQGPPGRAHRRRDHPVPGAARRLRPHRRDHRASAAAQRFGRPDPPGLRHRGLALAARPAAPLRGRQSPAAPAPQHQPPGLGFRCRERRCRHDLSRAAARSSAHLLAAVPGQPGPGRQPGPGPGRHGPAPAGRADQPAPAQRLHRATRLAALARRRRHGRIGAAPQPDVRQLPPGTGGGDRRPGRGAGARFRGRYRPSTGA